MAAPSCIKLLLLLVFFAASKVAGAWVTKLPTQKIRNQHYSNLVQQEVDKVTLSSASPFFISIKEHNKKHLDLKNPSTFSSRRDWMKSVLAGAATTIAVAHVDKAGAAQNPVSPSLCDPSVSSWQKPSSGRIVHLVGTAHISTSSAALAGQIIRDVRPNAVFVELDAKRVIPGAMSMSSLLSTTRLLLLGKCNPSNISPDLENILVASSVTSFEPSSSLMPMAPFGFNPLEAAVEQSLRGMYNKLGRAGYKPGEEFVVAIQEGLKVGSVIVLGDQDVKVTMRRLTHALARTDVKKLMAPNSELERTMKQILPGENRGEIPSLTELKDATSRQQLSNYVESMKAKENIIAIMRQLKRAAPELYQVMVTERDRYMASGIDALNRFPVMVAVMGMAHVNGIEENLRSHGWKPLRYSCPRM